MNLILKFRYLESSFPREQFNVYIYVYTKIISNEIISNKNKFAGLRATRGPGGQITSANVAKTHISRSSTHRQQSLRSTSQMVLTFNVNQFCNYIKVLY